MNFRYLLILVVGMFFLGACSKDEPQLPPEEQIQKYLTDNNLTAQKTSTGLYYIIEEEGTGRRPNVNNEVTVHYHGELVNGTVFDSSIRRGTPATFRLTNVIVGWQIGIPLFKEGGKGKLIVPPSLGYGSQGQGAVPGDAVMIFDVELIDVL